MRSFQSTKRLTAVGEASDAAYDEHQGPPRAPEPKPARRDPDQKRVQAMARESEVLISQVT